MYPPQHGDDAERRWDKRKWNREGRLILLRAFPSGCLSPAGLRLRTEEERALPGTTEYGMGQVTGGFVGSPVSSVQMVKAKDRDILHLFDQLEDATKWNHPKDFMRGGSIQAAREFAEFAKRKPRRALRLIRQFKAGKQERPAGAALEAIAEEKKLTTETIINSVHELDDRGFVSQDFRLAAASALRVVAGQQNGLDAKSCDLLESWIQVPESELDESDLDSDAERSGDSLLWGSMTMVSPQGNYTYLQALTAGFLRRRPPGYDPWLTVLERHVKRPERTEVWVSLATLHLKWLRGITERSRVVVFLDDLFESHPGALSSTGGTLLLAHSHTWMPEERLHTWMTSWLEGSWVKGPQATGELAMIRRVVCPGDKWCDSLVNSAIAGDSGDTKFLAGLRTGVAHSAVHLWANPKYRTGSGSVIRQLIPTADENLAQILGWVLSAAEKSPVDAETERMLPALTSNPKILAALGRGSAFDNLSEYLAVGVAPEVIANFALSLVDAAGKEIGNIQSAWSAAARPLIDLSLTLQRYSETRSQGLTIFERLLEFGAYEAEKILRENDRRL